MASGSTRIGLAMKRSGIACRFVSEKPNGDREYNWRRDHFHTQPWTVGPPPDWRKQHDAAFEATVITR